jgi:hypothetical protein
MTLNNRPPNLARRRFLQLLAAVALGGASAATYVRLIEPRWLSVDRIDLPINGLPPALDGKRIAQLSDLHLSQYFSPDQLVSALETVARSAPDWLVLTGDFVGDHAEDASGLVEPLTALPIPKFAVFGNHDYWSDRSVVEGHLKAAQVNVLVNASIQLEDGLWLAGVDDVWSGRPDLRAALRDIPNGAPTLLLAHEPDYFDVVLHEQAPVTLQLSGHSHGGQVRLPTPQADATGRYSYAPVLPLHGRRYPIGLRQVNGSFVYTNRGLGLWPVPLRFNCRPELTVITLHSA